MKPPPLIREFLPLIVFWTMSGRTCDQAIAGAAVIASALAAGMLCFEAPRRPVRVVSLVQLGLLASVVAFGSVGNLTIDRWLATWGRGTVTLIVGLTLIVLVPFVPFTLQYTRPATPLAYWSAPTFNRINKVLSLTWAAAISVIGLTSILADVDEPTTSIAGTDVIDVLLTWVLPLVTAFALFRFTSIYPDRVINAGRLDGAETWPSKDKRP